MTDSVTEETARRKNIMKYVRHEKMELYLTNHYILDNFGPVFSYINPSLKIC